MDYLAQSPLTMATGKAGLAAGTTTTYTTANAVAYCIKGKAFSAAAATNGATPTADGTTGAAFAPVAANSGCAFVFSRDAAGTLRVSQGGTQALDVTGQFMVAPQFPAVPDSQCPFGYMVFKGGSTLAAPWTFGTSNLSGVTGATYTFVDVMTLPDRPQVS